MQQLDLIIATKSDLRRISPHFRKIRKVSTRACCRHLSFDGFPYCGHQLLTVVLAQDGQHLEKRFDWRDKCQCCETFSCCSSYSSLSGKILDTSMSKFGSGLSESEWTQMKKFFSVLPERPLTDQLFSAGGAFFVAWPKGCDDALGTKPEMNIFTTIRI